MKKSPPAPGATTVTAEMKLTVEVPTECWIDLLVECADMFSDLYCGHWLRSVEWDAKRGHLAWEDDGKHDHDNEPRRKAALEAWHKGEDEQLPKGWHRLDRRAAIKAFCEGVKLWGINWMDSDHNDARGYDVVVQHALLGELRYEP